MDSARITNHDVTLMFLDFNFISQGYEYGNDLAVEADLSVKLNAALDIMSKFPQGYLTNTASLMPQN